MTAKLERSRFKELSQIKDWDKKLYYTALYYAECGYYVIPVRKNAKKLPGGKLASITYADASKNADTISEWYQPGKGTYVGLNIGIACGKDDGVFAVDLDIKEGANGMHRWEALEGDLGKLPEGPVQVTPHGGRHMLLKWQKNAVNSTSKIGQGIDTRGGTADACKGHIVVWPSSIGGVRYKWLQFGKPPEAPKWLIDKLGDTWDNLDDSKIEVVEGIIPGRGNENITADDLENPVTSNQVEILLRHVDINDLAYEDWLRIGMSIKSEFPGVKGLEMWAHWSAGGERHQQGECTTRWNGFAHPGAVRIGTLFHFARLGGWAHDPERDDARKESVFDALVHDMNNRYAVLSVGGRLRVLRQSPPQSTQHSSFDLLDKETFKTLLENKIVYVETPQGAVRPISHATLWLAHPERRTYEQGLGLFPEGAPEGYFNTWEGFPLDPVKGDCSKFINLIKKDLCQCDSQLSEWLLDWCADLVQNPHDPKGCAVVLKGLEGTGKGTFAKALGVLMGPHFRHLIDDSYLTSNFNSHMMDALLVFADEITWGGNLKSAGKLRGIITERMLLGERKGVDALLYRNLVHMVIASNADWVVPAGQNSRRWFVLDVSAKHASCLPYFDALHAQLDNGGYEALLHYLLNRKITSNLRFAPVTDALEHQRELSAVYPSPAQWWAGAIDREFFTSTPAEGDFKPSTQLNDAWPVHVRTNLLYDEYVAWCDIRKARAVNAPVFKRLLVQWGAVDARLRGAGDRIRVLKLPDVKEAREQLIRHYPGILEKDDDDD